MVMKNYRRSIFFVAAILVSLTSIGQQENRNRTSTVDYVEYDRLVNSLYYATDKAKAITTLFEFVNKNFTAEDEEYFNARFSAASFLMTMGDHNQALLRYQEAIEAYEKHYPFYTRRNSQITTASIAYLYLGVSSVYKVQHLYEKNIRYLESKRQLLENHELPYIRQTFYSDLGESLFKAGQYDQAIEVLLQLKKLAESGALKQFVQSADEVYKIDPSWPEETRQQLIKAKAQYEEAMKKMEDQNVIYQRLTYSNMLSHAFFRQFRFEECIPYSKQAADDMEAIHRYTQESTKASLAALQDVTIPDSVRKLSQDANRYLPLIQKIGGMSVNLVVSALKSNQRGLAEQYATHQIEQCLLFQLSHDYPAAEKNYTELFQLLKTVQGINGYSQAAENYYKWINPYYLNLKVKSGQLSAALTQARLLIEAEEKELIINFQHFTENEKREFFSNYTHELERYYSLLLQLTENGRDQTGELLNKILQTKGLILDATREQERQLRKIKDKVTLTQIAEIKRLRDRLAIFNEQLSGSNQVMMDTVNRLSVRIADLERAVNLKLVPINILKNIRWQDVQARLKKGEVYLEILRLPRDNFEFDKPKVQYWAFVIKPGEAKPTFFQITGGEAFEGRSLRNYQNRLRNQLEDSESYNLYWKNISDHIGGAVTVIVSADGVYHVVNPVALQNPATGKFVLDEVQVKRISTGRDLLSFESASSQNKMIVLVGNPQFDMSRKQGANVYRSNLVVPVDANETTRSGIMALPGTKKEIELIEKEATNDGFLLEMLTGEAANESNVKKLKSPAILHLATHGEFNQLSAADTYLKSKLILAGAADSEPLTITDYTLYEDGFLTAYEVTQLELSETRLVVLSACETGLGEIQSGEGVWGLQRAFQLAGAKTVMGSLWKISDEATVTFMEAFYKEYFTVKEVYRAYQAAMRTTRLQYPHPYYWGAFTLVGSN